MDRRQDTPGPQDPARLRPPCDANGFLGAHVELMDSSLRRWTGRALIPPEVPPAEAGRWLYDAPFAVLSHGGGADPLFTYANRTAQALFETDWADLVTLPSRLSAEPVARDERARLLAEVAAHGFIDDYSGVRISRRGRRFSIERATVWTLSEPADAVGGQAAMFRHWTPLA